MKKGLVMEGGSMRGMFTAGVTDVLMEYGIEFDGAMGTSAGACFGCNVKSKQPGRVIRYNTKYCKDPRYMGLYTLLTTGEIFGSEFAWHTVPVELDPFDRKTFAENPMEFYAVCTDLETGKPYYAKLENGDERDIKYMKGSSSMPLVSKIVEVDGHKFLDGGISDSVPLMKMIELGYEKNVVILTQPDSYRKKRTVMQDLSALSMREYPKAAKAMKLRHIYYNQSVKKVREEAAAGRAFVIQPESPLNISHACTDPGELMRVYEIGRGIAMKKIAAVKEYLGE